MRTLTAQERRTYDREGYVIVPDVIPPEELEAVDREIDHILARLLEERRARGEARGMGTTRRPAPSCSSGCGHRSVSALPRMPASWT
jgi:hypothetical protein